MSKKNVFSYTVSVEVPEELFNQLQPFIKKRELARFVREAIINELSFRNLIDSKQHTNILKIVRGIS